MHFSTSTSIILTLFAAALWGSWMQVVKLKKNYPIAGIVFWLYSFSLVFIWIVSLILAPSLIPEGIIAVTMANAKLISTIIMGGAMMSLGIYLNLVVMDNIGLMLATTITGAVGSLLGIFTSISKEGLPDKPYALTIIIITAIVFLLASYICSYASQMCENDRMVAKGLDPKQNKKKNPVTLTIIFMILLNAVLTNGWSIGTASGTAAGLSPILTCAYLCTGSFISVLLISIFTFTKNKQWKIVFCVGESKKPIVLGCISGLCHYGGNLMSIYSMPVISATISFLFGRTANLWTYFWGFYYKEFSGAKKKTLVVLAVGLLLYFVGIGFLFYYNYG
jgi:hypothetical protein